MDVREKRRVTSILILALIVLGIVYVDWAKKQQTTDLPELADSETITVDSEVSGEGATESESIELVQNQVEVVSSVTTETGDTEESAETQLYANNTLGFGMTIPESWTINRQSQPGKYTVRFEGKTADTTIFMNMWVHEVTIDVVNDPSGLLNGYQVFVDPTPTCPEHGGLCDVASMRIPYSTGDMPEEGEWTTRVVEIIYGASLNGDLSAPKTPDTQIFEDVIKTFFFL